MVGRRHVGLDHGSISGPEPADLRLGAGAQLEARVLAERGVGAAQVRPHARRQRRARIVGAVAALVEVAVHPREPRVPRQHLERGRVRQGHELLRLTARGDQRAGAAGREVGDGRAVELDAALQVPRQVPGRDDLRHHPAVQGHELVVDELDAGLADACGEVGLLRGVGGGEVVECAHATTTSGRVVAVDVGRPVAVLAIHDRVERLLHLELARPHVATVDLVAVGLVPARVGGDHVGDDRPALAVEPLVRRRAVPAPAVVERAAAGGHLDRHPVDVLAYSAGTTLRR